MPVWRRFGGCDHASGPETASLAGVDGKAGVEGDITDSLTGVRLMGAVDERQGTKAIRGGFGKWSDVEQAFDFWAERLRGRLASPSGS